MATMFPSLSESQLNTLPRKLRAEVELYRALRDQLPNSIIAMHSVDLHRTLSDGSHRDGEADFILFDPGEGILVIEVKGGKEINYDPRKRAWFSTSLDGSVHRIKDPFRQGKENLYESILLKLQAHPGWGSRWVPIGYAAFFPGVHDLSPLLGRSNTAPEVVGGLADLKNLGAWYKRAVAYWKGRNKTTPLGADGLKVVDDVFLRPMRVRALVSVQLAQEEEIRILLTEDQARILRFIGNRRRAAISGGAGTGKTQLAVEQARRMASEKLRTLLVCFNTALADHLKCVLHGTEHLVVSTFEFLCRKRVDQLKSNGGPDYLTHARKALPGQDPKVHLAFALGKVAEREESERFDVIVVDEGQDFLPSFWLPIQALLKDREQSRLYVFYDDNQSFYVKAPTFPIEDEPLTLFRNCRNTKHIHTMAYGYYKGPATDGPELEGEPIETVQAALLKDQAERIGQTISELLTAGVRAEEIVVLIAGSPPGAHYDALMSLPLPDSTTWSKEEHRIRGSLKTRAPGRVLLDTVRRFKGLEAQVVFLWNLENLPEDSRRELLYVGMSRAKSRLYLVGTEAACNAIQSSSRGNSSPSFSS